MLRVKTFHLTELRPAQQSKRLSHKKNKYIGDRRAIQHRFFTIPTYMAFTTFRDKLTVVAKTV